MHSENCFITLTYDQPHLPDDESLDVTHLQSFLKKLRAHLVYTDKLAHCPPELFKKVRFYACGEYGPKASRRPHYHMILFGHSFLEDRTYWKDIRGNRYFKSELLSRLWGNGFCSISNANFETAGYVARYISKQLTGAMAAEEYGDRKPPFTTMSRRPGIGQTWLDKYKADAFPSDFVVINGKQHRPPKFYEQSYTDEERASLADKRAIFAETRKENQTPARLGTREESYKIRAAQIKRDHAHD